MAVFGKCRQRECGFAFDDAEHIDDALAKLQSHFRTEHPTKALYVDKAKEQLEGLNLTLDEAVALYAGRDWRGRLERNEIQARNVTHACSNICRYPQNFSDEVLAGARALSAEHGVIIPDPQPNDNLDLDFVDNIPYDPGFAN